MVGTVDLILNIILLIFSISAVIWGVFGFVYRYMVSKKSRVGYLEVEMPPTYQILFWIIVIPLFIIFSITFFLR